MKPRNVIAILVLVVLLLAVRACYGWGNGPPGNATTNKASECGNPPESTHDWIAIQAMRILPFKERGWLLEHEAMFRLGTEAPDNSRIPEECSAPNTGYDDRRKGHSVEWGVDRAGRPLRMVGDRAARRAEEEYKKALVAYREERFSDAAFYLGAMAHYIGDCTQHGHGWPGEKYHSRYETWVKRMDHDDFLQYIKHRGRRRMSPYKAVAMISQAMVFGAGTIRGSRGLVKVKYIRPGKWMDDNFPRRNQRGIKKIYLRAVGESLNFGVQLLSDVLFTFYHEANKTPGADLAGRYKIKAIGRLEGLDSGTAKDTSLHRANPDNLTTGQPDTNIHRLRRGNLTDACVVWGRDKGDTYSLRVGESVTMPDGSRFQLQKGGGWKRVEPLDACECLKRCREWACKDVEDACLVNCRGCGSCLATTDDWDTVSAQ